MASRLDDLSISCVLDFLPPRAAGACLLTSRRWSVATAVFHRQIMNLFDELAAKTVTNRGPGSRSDRDYVRFCDQFVAHGVPTRFLRWVRVAQFKMPKVAHSYITGLLGDHDEIIDQMYFPDGRYRETTLETASGVGGGGHADIVRELWRLFNNEHHMRRLMSDAARCGRSEVIEACFEMDARTPVVSASYDALAKSGHFDLTPRIHEHIGISDYVLKSAASNGHVDIIRTCIQCENDTRARRESNATHAMRCAAIANTPRLAECIRLCHRHGGKIDPPDLDTERRSIIATAARNGNTDAVGACIECGSRRINDAIIVAAIGGHVDIVRQCRDGATNVAEALAFAVDLRHDMVARVCREALNA